MNEENKKVFSFTPQMVEYIDGLLTKAQTVNLKTNDHSNCVLKINDFELQVRVDDIQLFFIGSLLLPNIMNYLLNILPQFLYPYVVAYLQDLSTMRDDPIMITELYDYLVEHYGNI